MAAAEDRAPRAGTMIFSAKARAAESRRHQALLLEIVLLFLLQLPTAVTGSGSAQGSEASNIHQADKSQQSPEANVHSYIDEPIGTLIKSVIELKALQPATDQQDLPMILERTGERVDDFFRNFVDVAAKEEITEEKLDRAAEKELAQYQYNYIIQRDASKIPAMVEEYRTDAKGNVEDPDRPFVHYFFTSGFAASMMYFSKDLQSESTYRYLGKQMIGTRRAYAVAFAEIPGKAIHTIKMKVQGVPRGQLLLQGIAWVDEGNFQILKMRTDPLELNVRPGEYFKLDELQTVVTFSEVEPQGVWKTMWLPTEVDVFARFRPGFYYRNEHRFADYRRYGAVEADNADLEESARKNDAQAHPYLEEPLKELVKRIPELKGIRPAADQQELAMILQKTGARTDKFFSSLVDLIAREEITHERPRESHPVTAHVRDSYLIVRRTEGAGARFAEFRMDENGNHTAEEGGKRGFIFTSGFAMSSVHFTTAVQWDSRFLLLGAQTIKEQDTYVVAFAQLPGEAHNTVTMVGPRGVTVHLLQQGIVWVDKNNFHILRMRTDLLAPQPEIALYEETTKIEFSEVRFADVAIPLWLPRDVDVNVKVANLPASQESLTFGVWPATFRNVHRYTNYRRYRVAAKILATQ